VVIVISIGTLVFGSALIELLTSNFSPEKRARSEEFLRLLFPFAICFGVAAVLRGYLQVHGRFALSSIIPAAVPACTIVLLTLTPGTPDGILLPISASVGAILLVAILCWDTRKVPGESLLRRPGRDTQTRAVVRNTFPLLAGGLVMEGCFFVDMMMATSLAPGSVATLSYGERICTIVLAIAGTAAGQVLFPHVSELVAQQAWKPLRRVLVRFSALILALALPFVLLFWIAAEPIVHVLFERGEFTAGDTQRVAEVLRFASFQIPGYILVVLSSRVIMALRANNFLLLTTVFGLALNVVLNLLFMRWFGLKGIALSTGVVTLTSAVALYLFFAIRIRRLMRDSESA
jgi:putative peptidoglycan lipid II flippase